jgi:hypothetical protein
VYRVVSWKSAVKSFLKKDVTTCVRCTEGSSKMRTKKLYSKSVHRQVTEKPSGSTVKGAKRVEAGM